jgi:hypothetical protein
VAGPLVLAVIDVHAPTIPLTVVDTAGLPDGTEVVAAVLAAGA